MSLIPVTEVRASRNPKNRKVLLIDEVGGKRDRCGVSYNGINTTIFDFHHRIPDGTSFEFQLEGLKKCDLLCANCHRLMHSEEY